MNKIVAGVAGFILAVSAGAAMAQTAPGALKLGASITKDKALESIVVAGGYDDDLKPGAAGADTVGEPSPGMPAEKTAGMEEQAVAGVDELKERALVEGVDMSRGELSDDFFARAARQEAIIHPSTFETAGFIGTELASAGEVIDGEPSTQASFSFTETVYIDQGEAQGVKEGDRFLVYHMESASVRHPLSGKKLGHKILVDGVIEVVDVAMDTSKAVVVQSYDSIERGEAIRPYSKPDVPSLDPDRPVSPKDIEGVLVASKEPKEGYATGDVVYFDVGASTGVEPGDVFNIIDVRSVVRKGGQIVSGLPKVIGRALILATRDSTSTAFITASRNAIYAGDKVSYSSTR